MNYQDNIIKENSQDNFSVYKQDFIEPIKYHKAINKLRDFFLEKNFVETPTQPRLSILAACEDPTTIQTYNYEGKVWPLPQTGQMWLEYELLTKPDVAGYYCISTSYRQEENPIPDRHKTIFPMFEFETHGGIEELEQLEKELIEYLGISNQNKISTGDYAEIAKKYNATEISAEEESMIWKDYGDAFLLKNFPEYTSPFWNMKVTNNVAHKIDAIICGQETIGSAERSVSPEDMYRLFHTISDGKYAAILYAKFGKDRVEKELEDFLNLNFFKRCGGGIGITRLIRSLEYCNII